MPSNRDDRETLPPEPVTLESVYRLQVQQSEQLAVLISVVRDLANEVALLHEAERKRRQTNGSPAHA